MKITLVCIIFSIVIVSMAFSACKDDSSDTKSLQLLMLGGVSINMVRIPGGFSFPTGTDNLATGYVGYPYLIGETEVTFKLWEKVYRWAIDHGYAFANEGFCGGPAYGLPDNHPVTDIDWRDAMVWCNALTEWYNAHNGLAADLACVYYYDTSYRNPIRDSLDDDSHTTEEGDDYNGAVNPNSGGFDHPRINEDADGFRLPSSEEWELAARYIDGATWLYGDHASGDLSGACYDDGSILGGQGLSTVFGDYAVYDFDDCSFKVKSKLPNFLGLYDMSGNVWEWTSDWYTTDSYRLVKGGAFNTNSQRLQVGYGGSSDPFDHGTNFGFRVARTE